MYYAYTPDEGVLVVSVAVAVGLRADLRVAFWNIQFETNVEDSERLRGGIREIPTA